MDRDPPPLPPPSEDVLPPPDPGTVYRVAGLGAAVCGVTAVAGLAIDAAGGGGPSVVSTGRLIVVAIGLVIAGGGLSMRPGLPLAWVLAGAAGLLSRLGLPEHWDSVRMLVTVGGVVGLIGGGLAALSRGWRYGLISVAAVAHFAGIFCATTWPDPTPWATQQVGTRVYLPYLMFMYLRNAYHFYSPDPGPASVMFCLVTFEEPDPKTGKPLGEWVTLPDRGKHWKDPLGLAYYRRLSLTDQIAHPIGDIGGPTFEKKDVYERRMKAAGGLGGYQGYPRIPLAPEEFEPTATQYGMPRPDVSRYILPAYAAHVLRASAGPGRTPKAVKIYRLDHRVIPVKTFADGMSPHHPITFRPYFLGEFALDPDGVAHLVDQQDPMLYWLVPILPKLKSPTDPADKDYEDFLSKHAGYTYDWTRRTP